MDQGSAASWCVVVRAQRPLPGRPTEREVPLPPLPPARQRGDNVGYLVGALGSFGLVGVMVVGAHGRQLVVALAAAVLSIGGVGLAAVIGARRDRSRAGRRRRRWVALSDVRIAAVEAAGAAQRTALDTVHPRDVNALRALAQGGPGLWQRGATDLDRLTLGVGRAAERARVTVAVDGLDSGLDTPDESCLRLARAAAERTASVADCPVTVDLVRGGLAIVGPAGAARALARWLVMEAVSARPPHELTVGVVTDDVRDDGAWSWLRWLPHAHDPAAPDGSATIIAPTSGELRRLLQDTGSDQLIVVDGALRQKDPFPHPAPDSFTRGIIVVVEDEADLSIVTSQRVDLRDGVLRTAGGDIRSIDLIASLSQEEADEISRTLSPLRAADGPSSRGGDVVTGLVALLGEGFLDGIEPARMWEQRSDPDELRIPLGTDALGEPKWLDLKESAAAGMGPHGLVVGATGTGKSEVLRTIVTGLIARHSPEELALLLIDFKGGAAFDPFAPVPHVAGLVTNLAEDASLVERVCQALDGELADRQTRLRRAGVESVRQLRRTGGPCPPSLVVVIDEFSELLTAWPEALDVLLRVGRLGRSLGMHLVLAAQRWEEGRLRGLEAHLRWRLCLRTFTPAESVAVLGTPAAATLPAEPGAAWLAVDGSASRVRVAFSGAPRPLADAPTAPVRPLRLRPAVMPDQSTCTPLSGTRESERDAIVRAIRDIGSAPTASIWLPPLGATVDTLAVGAVGLVDRPRLRRQEPLRIDALVDGPVAVVGAPGSGVSGLLGALAGVVRQGAGIAVLAFGGSGLDVLARDPAVVAWADASDRDHATAVLDAVVATALGAANAVLPVPLLLLVDGVARARDIVDDLDGKLARIASAAGSGATGLVLGAQRWGDFRGGLRDLVPTRVELRLADPADSIHGRAVAAALSSAPPGRGLTAGGEQVQFLRPSAPVPLRLARVAHRVIEPLPAVAAPEGGGFAIRAGDLAPVSWSQSDGHLIVLGDRGSGRSNALRQIVTSRPHGRVLVVDPRRSLDDVAGRRDVTWTTGDAVAVAELGAIAAACAEGSRSDLLVVVDDADLLPVQAAAALAGLAPHLRRAEDLGVSLVLGRPVTGWLRASFDPLLQALRDSSPSTLLLAGDPAEGPVAGALRARRDLPGRGRLVDRRGDITLVQVVSGPIPAREQAWPPQWRAGVAW